MIPATTATPSPRSAIRRLSIIDVAGGHQPMANEDGSLWIVFNGEIFNHADLRPALEQAGHRYQTRCDTETILHAYEQYGPDCVRALPRHVRLRHLGQERRKRSSAHATASARSPSTITGTAALFAFASEIKALLAASRHFAPLRGFAAPRIPGLRLRRATTARCSRGIRKLMPGHSPHARCLQRICRSSKSASTGRFPRPPNAETRTRRLLDLRMPRTPGRRPSACA